MTDSTAAYTSEFVCNKLARRVVQGLDAVAHANATQFTNNLLIPIAQRLSHGKMMRGALKLLLDRTVATLRGDPHVIGLTYDSLTRSKLSSKEEYRLAFVVTSAVTGSEDWVTFIATEVIVSRKELRVSSTNTDLRIHRHALAKYMYRELKPTDKMMGDLDEALYASALIGTSAIGTETRNVAIPLKEGMLFGQARLVSNAASPSKRMRFRFKRNDPEMTEEVRETLMDTHRAVVEIMTYVDWNSLTPAREYLHADITRFMRDHAQGMKHCFEASYYETTVVQAEDEQDVPQMIFDTIKSATEAAKALVESKQWRFYEANVGANG